MTIRIRTKYKICRKYKTDIWSRALITKKITKFSKSLKPRRRKSISLGNFTGVMEKAVRIYRKRKTRYGRNLATKQKLLKFYGRIKERQFKRYLLLKKRFKTDVLENTLKAIEQRVDVALFRSHLVRSIFDSRLYILHKNVAVNKKIISKPSYELNIGDMISTLLPYNFWQGLKRTPFISGYCPEHLFVNWKSLKLTLYNIPKITRSTYPFKLRYKRILEFYKV